MKLSTYVKLPDAQLVVESSFGTSVIAAAPAPWGMIAGSANALALKAAAFATKYDELMTAKANYETAIKAKSEARDAFVDAFQAQMTQCYATPTVLNTTFPLIHLDAREARQVRPLRQPLGLKVEARSTGYILASWRRNQNSSATTFILQQFSEEGEWETVWSGPRVRVELSGYTPGVTAVFRVVAAKGDEFSEPSAPFTIYGEGSDSGLRIAA